MSKAVTLEIHVDDPYLVGVALGDLKLSTQPRVDWEFTQEGSNFRVKRHFHDFLIDGKTGTIQGDDLALTEDLPLFLQYYSLAKIKHEVSVAGGTILDSKVSSEGKVTLVVESHAA
jgi:hypothetical protein